MPYDNSFWQDVIGRSASVFGNLFQNADFKFGRDDLPGVGGYQPMPDIFRNSTGNPFLDLVGAPTRSGGLGSMTAYAPPKTGGFSLTALGNSRRTVPGALPGAAEGEDQEVVDYIRQSAAARGIDPETAVSVARTEGVRPGYTRNQQNLEGAPAYGPFQLYIGGGLGDEALRRGLDPRNPNQWRELIDFSLDKAVEQGWVPFQGAARAGIGARQGIGQPSATPRTATTVPTGNPQGTGTTGERTGLRSLVGITPAQYGQGLDKSIADAICGPIAATAFARAAGRNPNFGEVLNLARDIGWTSARGMGGYGNAVKLIEALGVPAVSGAVDKNRIIAELRAGRPVVFDTDGGENGHYFVIEAYDAATDTFNLGESARALRRSGGRTNFRLEDVASLGTGRPYTAIYMRTN